MAKMQLKSWFINKMAKDERLHRHHFDTLKVFFKGLGLSEKEEPDQFEEALKVFFGK